MWVLHIIKLNCVNLDAKFTYWQYEVIKPWCEVHILTIWSHKTLMRSSLIHNMKSWSIDVNFTYCNYEVMKPWCEVHLYTIWSHKTLMRVSLCLSHICFFEYVSSFRVKRSYKRYNWTHFDLSAVHSNHKKLPHKVYIVHFV